MLNRREFLATASAPVLASQTQRKPNIVLIVLDDLGYGDFGCYGQRHIQTPNADRAAAEGLRFSDFYAGAAVCAPSRAVLMTGLHGGHAPVRANAGTIPILDGDVTVATVLQRAGYATGGFGKWGLGDAHSTGVPSRHGFGEFFGYLHQVHAHSYYPDFLWDNEKLFPLPGNKGGAHGQYSADLIAERSFRFLEHNRTRPFFLYACYTLPHAKFEGPDVEPYTGKPWPQGTKMYAAMVTRADRYIGTILKMLKDHRLEDNTLVLITSDNGAHSGEEKGFEFFRSNGSLRGEKTQLYEGGIRVPMIARWPGRIRAGAVSNHVWSFCDFMATAAEVAGAEAPRGDGIPAAPELFGRRQPKHDFLYWEHNAYDAKNKRLREERLAQALRMGGWKAVRVKPGAPLELYDLSSDPGEATDVAARNPGVVKKAEEIIRSARKPPRPHDQGSMEFLTS